MKAPSEMTGPGKRPGGGKRAKLNAPLAGAESIRWARRTRFNPIRQLEPTRLSSILDDFEAGNVREATLLWEAMCQRDEILMSVKPKRELAMAKLGWEVIALDDSPEALAHKAALEFFWNNVTATSVYDRNVRGGFSRFVRQLMEAVSYRYSAHHIVWEPSERMVEGEGISSFPGLTATFEHVPLYFFENRDGILRYLADGVSGIQGQELAEGEWLVTVGDGLMVACSICYMFKRMSVQDWVAFNEKFGLPGVHVETNAGFGTAEWDAVRESAAKFMNDWACVTSQGTKYNLLEAKSGGQLPFPPLVERMDRMMASLYRGADLSTMSAGLGAGDGASLQGDESELIEFGDAAMLSESLNQIDRMVLRWHFGIDAGLAYTEVKSNPDQDVKLDLEIDKFLLESGAPIAVADALERYNRTTPADGEDLLQRSAPSVVPGSAGAPPAVQGAPPRTSEAANTQSRALNSLLSTARTQVAAAVSADLAPLKLALANTVKGDDAGFKMRLSSLRAFMPDLMRRILSGELKTQAAIEQALGSALASGLTESSTT